jgi:hypothetical protein
MQITQLAPLGAEVSGIDVSKPLPHTLPEK